MKILVSACLLGRNCKYDGGNNALPAETLAALAAPLSVLSLLYTLFAVIPGLAVTVRRLHDAGHSGGFIFIKNSFHYHNFISIFTSVNYFSTK